MSTGGDDVMTRIGLDASGFDQGAQVAMRAARQLEKVQRDVARAIEDLAAKTAARKAEFDKLSAEKQIEQSERVARRLEADQKRHDRILEDSNRRREQIARDYFDRRQREADRAADAAFQKQQRDDQRAEAQAERQFQALARAQQRQHAAQQRQAAQARQAQERDDQRAEQDAERQFQRLARIQQRQHAAQQRVFVAQNNAYNASATAWHNQSMGAIPFTPQPGGPGSGGGMPPGIMDAASSIMGRMAGIGAAVSALSTISDTLATMRERMEEAGQANRDLRGSLRENAAVNQGGTGFVTPQDMAEVLKFRAATGMATTDDAARFIRSFRSSIEVSQKLGNIDAGTAEELMLQGGIMQSRLGGSPDQLAEMIGLIPMFGKVNSASDAIGQMEQIRRILIEGRGDMGLIAPLLEFAGSAVDAEGNMLANPVQAAGLVSFASLAGGPGQAGTRAEQLFRSVNSGFYRRGRGPSGAVEINGEKMTQGRFLEDMVGIKESDDPLSRVEKLFGYLEQNKPADVPMEGFLTKMGFAQSEERRVIQEMFRFRKLLGPAMQVARGGAGNAASDALAANQNFMMDASTGFNSAQALIDLNQVMIGQNMQPIDTLQQMMAAQNPIENDSWAYTMLNAAASPFARFTPFGFRNAEDMRNWDLREMGLAQMRDRLRAAGLEDKYNSMVPSDASQATQADIMFRLMKTAGINPVTDTLSGATDQSVANAGAVTVMVAGQEKSIRTQEDMLAVLRQIAGRMGASGALGPPQGPPMPGVQSP